MVTVASDRHHSLRQRLAVLQNQQFRYLLTGRTISILGDGLYNVAAMWLVFELTGSTFYTGLAGFLAQAPGILQFLVGPLVDRAQLDRVLFLSEVVQGILVLLIPLAAFLNHLNVYAVLVVMPLLAISNLFAGPAQQATLPRLVDDERLVRANSVFSVATKAVDAAAKGVAGILIAFIGAVSLYLVNAGTFAVTAICFGILSVPHRTAETTDFDLTTYRAELLDGITVLIESVAGHMLIASLMANFLMGVTLAILPAFAAHIGGAETYGLLLAGLTIGVVLGSVSASMVDHLPLGWLTIGGFVCSSVLWLGAIVIPGRVPTILLLTVSRIPIGIYSVCVLAVLQTAIPNELLGRVTAVISSATNIVVPAGLLCGGVLGEYISSESVMVAGGIGIFLMAMYWLLVPSLRRFEPPTTVASGAFGGE
ncbi:MFS transporter [Haladaptatus halobius]|uniref:MFS transporter n=1 Tax=Haladaptatus halobius TaxID=2884875 RepID=UPI001D0BCE59|nr:MFS transporter [Haladaptatus halobius]